MGSLPNVGPPRAANLHATGVVLEPRRTAVKDDRPQGTDGDLPVPPCPRLVGSRRDAPWRIAQRRVDSILPGEG